MPLILQHKTPYFAGKVDVTYYDIWLPSGSYIGNSNTPLRAESYIRNPKNTYVFQPFIDLYIAGLVEILPRWMKKTGYPL